jgi:hypothetical protein
MSLGDNDGLRTVRLEIAGMPFAPFGERIDLGVEVKPE